MAYAQSVSSTELINNARQYDGKAISYQGEVIGEVMRRGDHAWVNLNDGKNAIGIWMPLAQSALIAYAGSYKSKGDWIEVEGVFNSSCTEHGGSLDIHAQSVIKKMSGRAVAQKLNPDKKQLAIILAGILAVIWILMLFTRR
ncbi:MAG: DNA-binding protein [Candidatus Omnitrophota bacterium]|nr:DNA-binding protein [Candidatus Omnitrophota bacterium]